ncbi:MAG: M28 family peptidase [Acidobacteriia bacterium]|nr:M28 family peptidase [Terriglobia bacterium]
MRRMHAVRFCVAAILLFCLAVVGRPGSAGGKWDYTPSTVEQQAVSVISADSLRGHLSFIASDLLKGRKNGSPGEVLAAEYIASQFRRAGLKEAGDDGYFQTASGDRKTPLRNVIGLLPGSDPKLADSYVLLTAHYDGVGPRPGSEGGWNAANDDGSGTVTVVEIASALASLKERPRRSLVFMTFYGEETGGLGSRFYAQHPIFPIEKTIADVNLEQVGRTDSTEGDQSRRASLTGFDYSDLGEVFLRAGALTGVTVYKHEQNSDRYFGASDNAELALLGIPAHTLCVAFMFADYHGAGDTWQKVNYDNMALTDKLIATALLILAQSDEEPRWNPEVPRASRFLEAWKKRHEAGK